MRVVTLYGRAACHLCDEARAALESLRGEVPPFRLREVDIDSDEALLAHYLERIPVIEVDGELVSELVPDLATLRAKMDTLGP